MRLVIFFLLQASVGVIASPEGAKPAALPLGRQSQKGIAEPAPSKAKGSQSSEFASALRASQPLSLLAMTQVLPKAELLRFASNTLAPDSTLKNGAKGFRPIRGGADDEAEELLRKLENPNRFAHDRFADLNSLGLLLRQGKISIGNPRLRKWIVDTLSEKDVIKEISLIIRVIRILRANINTQEDLDSLKGIAEELEGDAAAQKLKGRVYIQNELREAMGFIETNLAKAKPAEPQRHVEEEIHPPKPNISGAISRLIEIEREGTLTKDDFKNVISQFNISNENRERVFVGVLYLEFLKGITLEKPMSHIEALEFFKNEELLKAWAQEFSLDIVRLREETRRIEKGLNEEAIARIVKGDIKSGIDEFL